MIPGYVSTGTEIGVDNPNTLIGNSRQIEDEYRHGGCLNLEFHELISPVEWGVMNVPNYLTLNIFNINTPMNPGSEELEEVGTNVIGTHVPAKLHDTRK